MLPTKENFISGLVYLSLTYVNNCSDTIHTWLRKGRDNKH